MRWMRGVLAAALCLPLSSCVFVRFRPGEAPVVEFRSPVPSQPECAGLKLGNVALQEEVSLGDAMALRVVSTRGGLVLGAAGGSAEERQLAARARRVALVGAAVAHVSDRPSLPWRFGILRASEVNAVSAPGGAVFITRGALARVQNEDQLAGILAHEVAHVTGRHALGRYGEEKARTCDLVQVVRKHRPGLSGLPPLPFADHPFLKSHFPAFTQYVDLALRGSPVDFGDALLAPVLGSVSEKLVDGLMRLGLDKEAEFEADAGAVDLLLALGYRPEEFIRFVEQLPHDGDVFSQHPAPSARREALRAHLERRRAEGSPLRPPARQVPVPLPPELQ
jgi:predicted Zn-dependent protease